jgi:hypothetical protein
LAMRPTLCHRVHTVPSLRSQLTLRYTRSDHRSARYFGAELNERTLEPGVDDWLSQAGS